MGVSLCLQSANSFLLCLRFSVFSLLFSLFCILFFPCSLNVAQEFDYFSLHPFQMGGMCPRYNSDGSLYIGGVS